LVEDSATMRIWLSHQIRALFPSSVVLEAEEGRAAMRQLTSSAVDLVITDLRMPGIDGEAFVQMLRRNPLLRRKPVLVVSADAESARAAWGNESGIAILPKPLEPAALHSAILGLLGA
jgi:CheY-like chemotaxis protein